MAKTEKEVQEETRKVGHKLLGMAQNDGGWSDECQGIAMIAVLTRLDDIYIALINKTSNT